MLNEKEITFLSKYFDLENLWLVGSRAFKQHFSDIEPSDLDIIVDNYDFKELYDLFEITSGNLTDDDDEPFYCKKDLNGNDLGFKIKEINCHLWPANPEEYVENVPLSYQGIAINLADQTTFMSQSCKDTISSKVLDFNLISDLDDPSDDNIKGDFINLFTIHKKVDKLRNTFQLSEVLNKWHDDYKETEEYKIAKLKEDHEKIIIEQAELILDSEFLP